MHVQSFIFPTLYIDIDIHITYIDFIPRCGHCKNLAPTWQKLAEKFNNAEEQEIVVAKVDCTVETALCSGN